MDTDYDKVIEHYAKLLEEKKKRDKANAMLGRRKIDRFMKTKKPVKQSELKKTTLTGKETKVMKASSTAHLEDGKPYITTNMKVKEGLSPKDKKALKASVMKAIEHHIKGGMIGEDNDEEKYEPVKPQPLVRHPRAQERLEKAIDEKVLGAYNPMDLITDNWDELDDKEAIKRYFMLNELMDEVSHIANPFKNEMNIMPKFSDATSSQKMGMNANQFYKYYGEKARDTFKKKKNAIYRMFNATEGTGLYASGRRGRGLFA